MAQQVKRDPHKPDHTSYSCPWCGGQGYIWTNTTQKAKCKHCLGKGRVSPEKAATYQNSFIARRKRYIRKQEESKSERMRNHEQVRLEIESGSHPKDNPDHPYWSDPNSPYWF